MKYLIIVTSVIFSVLIQTQDGKMKGKYKMEYEQQYSSQNCIINFNDSTYKKQLTSGKTIKGSIEYQKYFIILNDKKSNLQVIFPKREMEKDTIYFRTKDLNDKSAKEMELTIYAGKLIRTK